MTRTTWALALVLLIVAPVAAALLYESTPVGAQQGEANLTLWAALTCALSFGLPLALLAVWERKHPLRTRLSGLTFLAAAAAVAWASAYGAQALRAYETLEPVGLGLAIFAAIYATGPILCLAVAAAAVGQGLHLVAARLGGRDTARTEASAGSTSD